MRTRVPAGVLAAVVGLSGCSTTLSDVPLPGGTVAGPTYRITATFDDALNLPEGARVRLDGVDVGRVESISARDFRARVQMRIMRAVTVTDAARLQLRSTTPLGEGFVDIDPGDGVPLRDGDVLPAGSTESVANIEDTLTAAALLLSGGGLGQLKTIVGELNTALDGRSGDVRSLLRGLNRTLGAVNERTDDIDAALTALDGLTGTLVARRDTVKDALRTVGPTAALLADSTDDLVDLLTRLRKLGEVADSVVRRSRADLRSTLTDLEPVLDALLSVRDRIGPTLLGMSE